MLRVPNGSQEHAAGQLQDTATPENSQRVAAPHLSVSITSLASGEKGMEGGMSGRRPCKGEGRSAHSGAAAHVSWLVQGKRPGTRDSLGPRCHLSTAACQRMQTQGATSQLSHLQLFGEELQALLLGPLAIAAQPQVPAEGASVADSYGLVQCAPRPQDHNKGQHPGCMSGLRAVLFTASTPASSAGKAQHRASRAEATHALTR